MHVIQLLQVKSFNLNARKEKGNNINENVAKLKENKFCKTSS